MLKGTETYGAMTVTGSDNGTKWTTSPLTYWPSNASQQLDFYAYAPTTTTAVTINGTDKKITSYTPSTTVADQKDLVIAYNTGTKTANEASGVPLLLQACTLTNRSESQMCERQHESGNHRCESRQRG